MTLPFDPHPDCAADAAADLPLLHRSTTHLSPEDAMSAEIIPFTPSPDPRGALADHLVLGTSWSGRMRSVSRVGGGWWLHEYRTGEDPKALRALRPDEAAWFDAWEGGSPLPQPHFPDSLLKAWQPAAKVVALLDPFVMGGM